MNETKCRTEPTPLATYKILKTDNMENNQTSAEPEQKQAQEAQQQVYTTVVPEQQPPTYLTRSILSTIFGCIPFGIVAIVKASDVEMLWKSGKYEEAKAASRAARRWSLISFLVGAGILTFLVFYIILMVSFFSALPASVYDLPPMYEEPPLYYEIPDALEELDDLDFDDYGY